MPMMDIGHFDDNEKCEVCRGKCVHSNAGE